MIFVTDTEKWYEVTETTTTQELKKIWAVAEEFWSDTAGVNYDGVIVSGASSSLRSATGNFYQDSNRTPLNQSDANLTGIFTTSSDGSETFLVFKDGITSNTTLYLRITRISDNQNYGTDILTRGYTPTESVSLGHK